MKVYRLIQILCRLDPETEVLSSPHGPPIVKGDAMPVQEVYNHILYDGQDDYRDPDYPEAVVLTTFNTDYDAAHQRIKATSVRPTQKRPSGP